jgi:hypothetical protein
MQKEFVMKTLMKKIAFSTLILGVTGIVSAVGAVEMPERGPIPFGVYDTDKNGMVSEDEFYAARGTRMEQRAKEGYLMRGAASAPDFSEFDTDNDGQLTKEELENGQMRQMQKRRAKGMGLGQNQNLK